MIKRTWEIKQSAQPDTLDMYLYGDIEGDSYDWWSDTEFKSETSANYFREELAKHPNTKNINLYCNSYGGSVYEAMAIRNQLKRNTATVTGFVDGFAASAASFILTACDTVKMYSNTMQMIHNMWGVAVGNAKELRKVADDLDTIMDGNRKAYLEKSAGKITEEKLIEMLDAETWLTSAQCLEYGFCDEIIAEEKDLTSAKQMLQKANVSMAQHIEFSKSLAAQLREYLEPIEPAIEVDPIITEPEAPKQEENKLSKFLTALTR